MVMQKDAACDWPLHQLGPKCGIKPVYVLPHRAAGGLKYRLLCKEHILKRKIIPITGMIPPKTREAIDHAWEKAYPVHTGLFKAWMLFVVAGGPIMCLYSIAGSRFRFFDMTRFSFFWVVFGLSWLVIIMSESARMSKTLKKRLAWLWLILFMAVLLLEISLHMA